MKNMIGPYTFFFKFPGTMYFNAKHGCQRCKIVGKHSGISNTVIFAQTDKLELRTDALFRSNGYYPDHQKAISPLLVLPRLDMIKDFVVADPLHLLELGIMKRLLTAWKTGNMACAKWSEEQVLQISEHLVGITTPSEVNCAARSLTLFRIWKGQEFRNFLCYFGFIALRNYLSNYAHFMKLFCAIRSSSSDKYVRTNLPLIKILCKDFVEEFKTLYGREFMTSNVHNVLHIVEDVERFGNLSSISAYPFESYLGKIKRTIRAGTHQLKQIARRLIERSGESFQRNPIKATQDESSVERTGLKKCIVRIPSRNFIFSNYRFENR